MSIPVNPKILVWSRKAAGFDVEAAAEKLGFTSSQKSSAVDKLKSMEAGEKKPTPRQLDTFAKVYNRPLLTFYLSDPPSKGSTGQDFRQTAQARSPRENAILDALLRDVKARQEMVRDILKDEEDFIPPDFVSSANLNDGVSVLVKKISDRLSFDNTDVSLRAGKPNELFKGLRESAESIGVFVLVLGDLGSHHTTIPASVFRGFAISDNVAPFVVINAKDAQSARAFTLIHELAHIWLGQTGVSGAISTTQPNGENARIERFCNDVAGKFLLPEIAFEQDKTQHNLNEIKNALEYIHNISTTWSVSEPMVAYRLQRKGELTVGTYRELNKIYNNRWQELNIRNTEKQDNQGGPNRYTINRFNLGNSLIDLAHRGFKERILTHTKTASLLGIKPLSVSKFFDFIDRNRKKENHV